MILFNMLDQRFYLFAVEMNQFATFITFAVITASCAIFGMLIIYIFEAGGAAIIQVILVDNALIYQLVEMTIDCCKTDRFTRFLEMLNYIIYSNMLPLGGHEISCYLSPLPGLILRSILIFCLRI